jgi:hypothetical protein
MADDRPLSRCAECGQTDDHPKHMFLYPPEMGGLIERHMDCCPQSECDGSCSATIESADGKRGLDLAAHITGQEVS